MAIVQEEYICKKGVKLIHTWSDENFYIRQIETGIEYAEAYDIDVNGFPRFDYAETENLIEQEEELEEPIDNEEGDIIE